ncbi:MAG: ATP phosphoribosyltransferase [Proteobacteria bacterium]|nr:ATP phosphoribosyltransferase [Pseudomonadota bacterium]
MSNSEILLAVPRGRILNEFMPVLKRAGIEPEAAFEDDDSRKLRFSTNQPGLSIIRARSFDVATFVAFGAAQLGVTGNDVLMEFDYPEIYAPLDLNIGACRMSLCRREADSPLDLKRLSHLRVATKFPNCTRAWFAARGIQAECVELNGAMELAPMLGLAPFMVDLVATGGTLKANHLVEVEKIADVSSKLIVNRTAYKTRGDEVEGWISRLRKALVS